MIHTKKIFTILLLFHERIITNTTSRKKKEKENKIKRSNLKISKNLRYDKKILSIHNQVPCTSSPIVPSSYES